MIARRPAWIALLCCALVLVVLAWWLVPWDHGEVAPVRADEIFAAEHLERAHSYRATVRALSWSSLAVSIAVTVALGLLGHRVVARLPRRARLIGAVLAWQGIFFVLALPFRLAIRRRRLEEGLTTQGVGGWWQDRLIGLGIASLTTVVAMAALVWLARRTPRWWYAWAAGGIAVLSFGFSYVQPLVVEPLYNDFTTMPASPLRAQLFELAEREGVAIDEVLVADASRRTTALNAYVSGLAGSRRVVVYDNLLASQPDDQVISVVAHELAHVKHRDVFVGTLLSAVAVGGGVIGLALVLDTAWVRRRTAGAGDPRVIPAVLALVAVTTLLASPAVNAVSRAMEARADRTALDATQDPEAFERLQRNLAERSLSDPEGPRWSQWAFGTHPTVLERIGMARAWEAER